MVEHDAPAGPDDAHLDALFRALADPTRRSMLHRLGAGERTVGELARPLAMSLAAASKHIRVLERAGLVRREVDGRTHRVRLDPMPLHAGAEWLRHYERFWTRRLDALAALLEAGGPSPPASPARRRPPGGRP
ncbi:metalloregulator ArsR/SmtB family transcription factor [Luteimonas sp. Y-2-2-4F]|nr:metalloregulator ArsR/SmtB family transcription factor [Luteimonas sp. Y-2-2-4F]MCD9030124.1 metalloregulator ArsR/SmtB family transcription factor [Luteimonas sp. Y-2-2-4F]